MASDGESSTIGLIHEAKGGDRGALDELFRRHCPRIARIVALRFGRRADQLDDLEDIVQESLLDAFLHLDQFEPRSEGAFLNWLAKLALNNVSDAARKHAALKRGAGAVRPFAACSTTFFSQSLFASDESTPSQVAIGGELERRLETALLELEPRHRQVIDLRRLCGMSFEEIALEMGLGGESSARSLFSRAMGELGEKLR